MSVTLWINTEREETIELGATVPCYERFAELARAAGPQWVTGWPNLSGVLDQCEQGDDADPGWLADMREEARRFLAVHGSAGLSEDACLLLRQLTGDAPDCSDTMTDGFTGK